MPKYRKLHTKATESIDLNDMPDDFTRLLWVMLPLALCREGRGVDNPSWVRSKVFPLRQDVTVEMVQAAMDWYENRAMLVRYAHNGRGYFYVPTFHKYQGNTIKEAESIYPAPPNDEPATEEQATNSGASPELVQSKSSTDSIFNIQYSDSDADAIGNSDAGASKPAHARDYLSDILSHSSRKTKQPRTNGWSDCSEPVYAVCQRVADLWCASIMPSGNHGDRVEHWQAGALELLRYHDNDVRATIETLDRYQAHHDGQEKPITIAGPQSLVNVIPAFLAQGDRQSEPAGFAGLRAWAQQEGWT